MATAKTVSRAKSTVHALNQAGQVFKGFYIWTACAPYVKANPDICYVKCLVLPGSAKDVFKCCQIEPLDPDRKEFDVPAKLAYNVNSNIDPMLNPDIGMIPHTNDAAALDFLRQRYVKGQIYTEAKPLLVTINPFKNLNNDTNSTILKYRDASDIDKLPPHVFTTARIALENLHAVNKSQTIIVSGESGAGKTEAVKQVMRYFAAAQTGKIDQRIQTAVLAANPVLEAFGNAKTIRNNNSSRFGRFMQLQIRPGGGIEYGRVNSFLLEKCRILTQDSAERSYHIFYQLLKGANPEQKSLLKLHDISYYKILNNQCIDVDGIDDLEDWIEVQKSLDSMNLNFQEKVSVFSIISGILILGNVVIDKEFRQGIPDAACIDEKNKQLLVDACNLLLIDHILLEQGLLIKKSKAGNEEVIGFWKQNECLMLIQSLCKGIYDYLFHWLIQKLNSTIVPPSEFVNFIALLDIFGFEVFNNNSLEQLLINITNEMLQKNFIDAVFNRETKIYREEGISSTDLVWTTNESIIDVLINKRGSIMIALEDQCLAPAGSDEKFVASTHSLVKNNSKLLKPKVGGNIKFIVNHTIGQIVYNASGFLNKNQDILRPELVAVVQQSSNIVASSVFKDVIIEKGKLAKGQLISSQFLNQLNNLMAIINKTEPHFIRCIKPNEEKKPLHFVPSRVLIQLHSLSILEALQLRNLGYAYRLISLTITNDAKMSYKDKTQKLFEIAGIKTGWQLGKTMVFIKNSVVKELNMKQREAVAAWIPIVEIIEAMALRCKLKQEYEMFKFSLIRIQARCRQKLAGKVKAPPHNANIKGW